jgi:polyvinyl alcohol dehydrogenase (cytochrome)
MKAKTWPSLVSVVIKNCKFNRSLCAAWNRASNAGLLAVLLLTAAGLACGAGSACGGDDAQIAPADAGHWLRGGSDLHNTRFQGSETVINSSNVSELAPKWVVTVAGDISATPTTDGTNVYFPDWGGNINALAAATGEVIWQKAVPSRASPAIVDGGAAVIVGTPVFAGAPASIIKMDAANGAPIWTTIVDPHPAAVLTANPVVAQNTVIVGVSSAEESFAADASYPCCSFRGSVVAVDETTGSILWKTYMVPENGGLPSGYSGGAVWGSTPMVDLDRGLVYVATGNNYSVPDDVAACQLLMPNSPVCIDHDNRIDSVVAMDLSTGTIRWTFQAMFSDNSTNGCLFGVNCEMPEGPDHDFAQGPLFVNTAFGPIVFAGQKSGVGYGLNADSGALLWHTQIGTEIMWGSATDGCQIYVASRRNFTNSAGAWSALNPATGTILWTTNDPGSPSDHAATVGPVSVANGVVYGGSENVNGATMFGLDAKTGELLFSFNSGSSVVGGPAIAKGVVYWGSGYSKIPILTGNKKIYAFTLDGK